ncbi:DUF4197 domain-containing protein [Hymenobacter sp. BT175]|uniref:DUF4197 domain-containing protein n=1 Tax=Hymenobacter translucens TaxID=2886507 RepID=UPI001D0E1971|nr:DUF4197 domain-containing protein [Hymenobacter translucens]MCC2545047.1 DUF4197 domain-containing protein [Hymenobacter translucens]
MLHFRILIAALALGLTGSHATLAQTKAKTTTTTKKKTTTKAKAPVKKAPVKPAAKPVPAKPTAKPTAAVPAAPVLPPLTAEDANSALHEALNLSVTRAIAEASAANGFNGNADIRIAFPPEAELVSTTLRSMRLGTLVDNFEVALNRAAEAAAGQAKPIFASAVQNLSFSDAMGMLTSREPDAATTFLHTATASQLESAMQPIVQQSLEQTGATRLYAEMVAKYNKIPMVTPLNPTLTPYATKETVNGIFALIAAEEGRIRMNSAARTSELLQRTFGRR